MRDFIGEIAKSLNYSMENLKSAVINGQINPRDADLVRRRIERLKQPQPKPAQGGTVVEQGLQQLMAQGQQPSIAMQMEAPEEVAMAQGGLADLPVNMFDEANYAGGGIIAFADGDLVEDEYKGIDYDKMFNKYIKEGLPKSPVSKYFQYDVPRPETGYLKKRMETAKGEGLTALDVKGIGDREREAYGIKDIFGPRMKEVEGFKEQAEKTRDYSLGAAGLQAAAALLSRPTIGLAAEEASKTAIPTLLAGQREYVKDVRDASKLAFEAGAAQQAYKMDLFRGDTARAKENRTRYEAATDKLAAYDDTFLKSISDRLGQASESAAMWQIKTDAAAADGTKNPLIHMPTMLLGIEAKRNAMLDDINNRFNKNGEVTAARNKLTLSNLPKAEKEKAQNLVDAYEKAIATAYQGIKDQYAPIVSKMAQQSGFTQPEIEAMLTAPGATKMMAQPSKTTMTGVDLNNPLLKSKS